MSDDRFRSLYDEALKFHARGRPGKLEIKATVPMATQHDLSLAYSPGVAAPCLAIQKDPDAAYDYTSRGNMVAVISNGTAVLGLGNLGALAGKPVMEGKAVLFKRFADVDSIDLEVATEDVDEFVNSVRFLGPSFGGINLEDIKAPECFIIEQRLRELMDIPIFHDDQHGTAIISVAGLINALDLTGRSLKDIKLVVNGAGAAGIACLELVKAMGMPHGNAVLCDTKGVIYKGRTEGMNQWKSAHAVETRARTLDEAMKGADVFFGLSAKGAVTREMLRTMAAKPIVFAMANPDPEITPEEALSVRPDAIMATGRSDYPNQVNNVLGFPYIFRGALDVRARTINDAMKIAAAEAIARLARQDVPDEVAAAYRGKRLQYGPEYIIPAPFDPRLIEEVPMAVAKAAMESGVARRPIIDTHGYRQELRARLNPMAGALHLVSTFVEEHPKRIVFAEGEEESVIRAAIAFRNEGYGTPILVARQKVVQECVKRLGLGSLDGVEFQDLDLNAHEKEDVDFLYSRLQRQGSLYRDCQRLVHRNRNVLAACMVARGRADTMVTGVTRNYFDALRDIQMVIDPLPGQKVFGLTMIISKGGRTVFIADTTVHELPTPDDLAAITVQTAQIARGLGHEPRVALLSYSNFGNPMRERAQHVRKAVQMLHAMDLDFECDGEMSADVALNAELLAVYPFSRLSGPANVLIMPALHAANIGSGMLQSLGEGEVIGPLLMGLAKPVQIAPMGTTVRGLVNFALVAARQTTL
ncbi:NADP-dependent malic enzyme [Desertibaculum subflavum]|uniref:NADP-dependent malic enzyme n=1 Tax=Desertibaculum subflavum TaxID=2268458 RepID=UPI000E66771C